MLCIPLFACERYNRQVRIEFFDIMPGEEEALRSHLSAEHDVRFHEEALSEKNAPTNADIISVFVKSEVNRAVIDRMPGLKLISTRSMGYDHLDISYARSKGIRVVNVTTYASHPVAEFTFALLLNVTRRIYHAYNQLREGMNFDIRGLKGFNLYGKTLGVVGTGRIGRNVAAIARGFGMNVVAFDAHPDNALAAELGFTYATLNDLVAAADIVSLHLPFTEETRHLFDATLFATFKKGSIFINTARGELVDTHALVAALRDGTLWGAGLDVLEAERQLHEEIAEVAADADGIDYRLLTANHVLIDMPNVIVTPHIAFETEEAMQEITRSTGASITAFIAGTDQPYLDARHP